MTSLTPPSDSSEDVDEIAVERAVRGDKTVRLNRAEHLAAWQILERRGNSSRGIAAILGITPRTVVRWRTGEALPISRPPGLRSPHRRCQDCPGHPLNSARHRRAAHPEQTEMSA